MQPQGTPIRARHDRRMTDKHAEQQGREPDEIPDGSGPTNETEDTAEGGDQDQFQG